MLSGRNKPSVALLFCLAALPILLVGCKSILPARSVPVEDQAALFKAPTLVPTAVIISEPTPTVQTSSAQGTDCTNMLQYIPPDLTYPDGSEVKPGETIDKQWQVKNAGTCNWDSTYTLQFMGGEGMGAASPQALVPARNGTETVIAVIFTAPVEPGRYTSQWKAYG
ncbi:MAG: hypothetical protein CVU45_07150, partial [Chloroflexi bacterium HGW-Chloroflexi-7]